MSLVTSRLNEIGKKSEFRNQTTGKYSDEAFSMLQKDIDDYINTNMNQQIKTEETRIEGLTETQAKDEKEALKSKVFAKLVNKSGRQDHTLCHMGRAVC